MKKTLKYALFLLLVTVVTACSNLIIENSAQEKEKDEQITEITETSETIETTESTETAETTEPVEGENITTFLLDRSYYVKTIDNSPYLPGEVYILKMDTLYMIRTVDEFVHIFEKDPPAEIDFSQNSLLAVKAYSPNGGGGKITKSLILTEENRYVLNIVVPQGPLCAYDIWHVFVLTPPLCADDEVELNITRPSGLVDPVR